MDFDKCAHVAVTLEHFCSWSDAMRDERFPAEDAPSHARRGKNVAEEKLFPVKFRLLTVCVLLNRYFVSQFRRTGQKE